LSHTNENATVVVFQKFGTKQGLIPIFFANTTLACSILRSVGFLVLKFSSECLDTYINIKYGLFTKQKTQLKNNLRDKIQLENNLQDKFLNLVNPY
jgi:hypothetical protein